MTAPKAAPKNIAATDPSLLANLGLVPFAMEESAAIPVTVSVRTVVVKSGIASFRTAALRVPHGERHQSNQSERLKRVFRQMSSVISDGAKGRSQQKGYFHEERLCGELNLCLRASSGHNSSAEYRPYKK